MNNKKCPYCGFINFVDAEACRKCETSLISDDAQHAYYEAPAPYRGGVNSYNQPYRTKSSFTFGKVVLCVAGLVFGAIAFTWGLGIVRGRVSLKWIEYHPDGLDMTVMMPGEPTRVEPVLTPMAGGSMSNHTYGSVVPSQGTVVFCFIDYNGIYITDDVVPQALDAELNGFVSRTHSTLISKNSINYQGMSGLEFELSPSTELGSKGSRSYGKMFVNSTRLYFLSLTAGEGTDLLANKDKFLNPKINEGPHPPALKMPKIEPFKPLPPIQ